ncbi:phage tail assembly protein [Trabulsiella odontotermitis]|uniref:phage tail assembly protein n=1 Tax=Trabulsiella odontotermitis TaxID=379893 RepID=UPI0006764235|nr:phage tail assembly protein [Trabulsiella odontotermitis]
MEQQFEEELTIKLDDAVSTLNGKESWERITLREPNFAEVSDFYRESRKTNEHDAMAVLISVISGVNLMAVKKLPIRKFREAQAYLLGFLNYFPTLENGKTE